MDPKACLRRAAEALADGDIEECGEALEDYRVWRAKGGFAPAGCDGEFRRLQAELGKAAGLVPREDVLPA